MMRTPEPDSKAPTVGVWSGVSIQDAETEEVLTFTIVPPDIADPSSGKFSMGCPLVAGIMGSRAGESVKVQLRAGCKTFKILEVAPSPGKTG
ncbi:MAG: GreA/GreB family elongation factor [Elusimicrobiota bacterium]